MRNRLPLWTAVVIGAVVAAYGWTLATSLKPGPQAPVRADDYFNLLAHGFLKGHLYLDVPVPPELRALANPYDPAARPPGVALYDASLFHGHYYIYWGPTPVVLVFAPFMLLTGRDLPIADAILGFVTLSFVFSLAILGRLRSRIFPRSGPFVLRLSAATIGLADFSLLLLRRHSGYELPIACGAAFSLAALYCVIRALDSARPAAWAAAAGVAIGLAIGARPVWIVAGGLLLLPWLWRPRPGRWGLRETLAGAAPCALLVAGLLAYNYARFGNVLEFGVRYQLSGQIESQVRHFSLTYLPFNADAYLFAPLRWGRYFPFVHWPLLPPYPAGYGSSDSTFGILVDYPFVWLSLGAAWAIVRGRRVELGLVAGLTAGAFLFLLGFGGAIGRYLGDFGPHLLLFAALGVCAIDDAASPALRGWFRPIVALAALATVAVAALTSLALYHRFADYAPRQYARVSRWADGIAAGLEPLSSRPIAGPFDLQLDLPDEPVGTRVPIVTTGWAPETDAIVAEYAGGRRVSLGYLHAGNAVAWSPDYPLGAGTRHRLRLDLGSFYPPADHPFFRGRTPSERTGLRGALRAEFDHGREWRVQLSASAYFPSAPGTIDFGANVVAAARLPLLPPAAAPVPSAAASNAYRGVITLQADWAGRSLPLITCGRSGAGDALSLRPDGRGHVVFAYDHWNAPLQTSPPIPWAAGAARRIAFTLPGDGAPLTVTLDGKTAWSTPAAAYPTGADERFPGRNAIGASTCEAELPGAALTPDAASARGPVR